VECPKCEAKAYQYAKREIRQRAGEPITEIRSYACSNLECEYAFSYKNIFMTERDRIDVARWIKKYEERKTNQSNLFEED
jgi:hypothetical protein